MRRIAIAAAAFLGLGFIGQASADAGLIHKNQCGGTHHDKINHTIDTLGFSYFRCHHGCPNKNNCPPYIYPHRAPRDFWMLR
jgi:hypothetical protein